MSDENDRRETRGLTLIKVLKSFSCKVNGAFRLCVLEAEYTCLHQKKL